jgi:acyl carrier protein
MGTISSKTPGGLPGRCPVCGTSVIVTPSEPLSDAPCPACGVLLWPVEGSDSNFLFLANRFSPEQRAWLMQSAERLRNERIDSLDQVELIMDLEDMFDVTIPDEISESWRSIDDFLKWWIDGGPRSDRF